VALLTSYGVAQEHTHCNNDRAFEVARNIAMRDRNGLNSLSRVGESGLAMSNGENEATQRIQFRRWVSECLNFDGMFHRATQESRYRDMTFGLAGDHGETALMVDEWQNPNIGLHGYPRKRTPRLRGSFQK